MPEIQELKLKQASAVLGVPPKDLQNLVQFRVIAARKEAGIVYYDTRHLYAAKVALYIRNAFGTSTARLSGLTKPLIELLRSRDASTIEGITFLSRPSRSTRAIEIKVPFRELVEDVDERIRQLHLFEDVPRGRKRAGWKRDFLAALGEAAEELGKVPPQEELLKRIREYRRQKRAKPEITVVAQTETGS